jgi:NADPH:quinone reductase-like Zn-dependent oxidoreductase
MRTQHSIKLQRKISPGTGLKSWRQSREARRCSDSRKARLVADDIFSNDNQTLVIRDATSSFGLAALNMAVEADAKVIATTRKRERFRKLEDLGGHFLFHRKLMSSPDS